jgi:hypothetical protein
MDRGELEGLDRETLVVRAQAAGIRRARILTRPELIDELLRLDPTTDEAQLRKSRGFFGRARDLVARVVERGLHLPDAAERIREIAGGGGLTLTVPRTEPQAMPTVTLAEIYAAQGHSKRAIDTLRRVLEREPEHAAARVLLARLEDDGYVAPPPPLPPEPENEPRYDEEAETKEVEIVRPQTMPPGAIQGPSYDDANGEAEFSLAPASERAPADSGAFADDPAYAPTREIARREFDEQRTAREDDAFDVDVNASTGVFEAVPAAPAPPDSPDTATDELDECFAIPLASNDAGGRTYVRWSVSFSAIGVLLGSMPRGRFVVRANVVTPGWDGPTSELRDFIVDPDDGEATLQALPEPSVVRVAVGWLDGATFVPLAHSPALEVHHARGLVVWTPKGLAAVAFDGARAASFQLAVAAAKRAASAHG